MSLFNYFSICETYCTLSATTVSRSPSNICTIFFFKNSCRNMTIQMFVYDF